jgi:hypothetical protein
MFKIISLLFGAAVCAMLSATHTIIIDIEESPQAANLAPYDYYIAPDPCTLTFVSCNDDSGKYATIQRIAQENDFDNWHIIAGICYAESHCGVHMYGDNGKSGGYYHIYEPNVCEKNGYAKYCIMSADRFDLKIATKWTIDRQKRHMHLGQHDMIRSHNGLPADRSNDWYPARVMEYVDYLKGKGVIS